tara:strand:+ start:330 stop:929 length:600 start_codon:yes stop_codon:yes gene_type:complete
MKLSKLIRRTHMYLALFLTPWLIIYALSGLVLNHAKLFLRPDGQLAMPFEKVEMRDYKTVFSADADARMIGTQVLENLGLSGTFNTQGNPHQPKLVINRNGAFAIHRITYFREQGRLLVEKQPLRTPTFLNRTHFRHGYEQDFVSTKVWAVIVDLVVVALLFWVISGVWMWWEIKPARLWGGVFGLIGLGIFGILLATI